MEDALVWILSILSILVLYWIFFGEKLMKKKLEGK